MFVHWRLPVLGSTLGILLIGTSLPAATQSSASLPAGTRIVADQGAGTLLAFRPDGTRMVLATNLQDPRGIAVDQTGSIIVAESRAGRITRVNLDGSRETIRANLDFPEAVAVGPEGNVYATTFGDGRVQKFTEDELIVTVETVASGLNGPTGLAMDWDNGDLFVAEWVTGIAYRFSNGSGAETSYRKEVLAQGLGNPSMIALAPDEDLYVADFTGKLYVIDTLSGDAAIVAEDPFTEPVGVALDLLGDEYTISVIDGNRVYNVREDTTPIQVEPVFDGLQNGSDGTVWVCACSEWGWVELGEGQNQNGYRIRTTRQQTLRTSEVAHPRSGDALDGEFWVTIWWTMNGVPQPRVKVKVEFVDGQAQVTLPGATAADTVRITKVGVSIPPP